MKMKVLVVAAHPDDEVLGCGGTMARLHQEGNSVFSLILGKGVTARIKGKNDSKQKNKIKNLEKEMRVANKTLGVKEIFSYDYPDNSFDSVSVLEIIKTVEKVKRIVKPNIIFTHLKNDLNIDHQITHRAVLTASRPQNSETVEAIYSFPILSSTEWNYPLTFSPNIFFDITKSLDIKLKAMGKYRSELRKYPHPRSLKGIRIEAQYWGMKSNQQYTEPFQLTREMK